MIKMMRLKGSRSRRRTRRVRQLVDDDLRAEMRGGEKDATANIATGIATVAEAAAGKDTGSIEGGIETTMVNRLHVVTVGAIGAGVVVETRIIADDISTMGPHEAEVEAENIVGRREMATVEDLQTDGGVSVLSADAVKDNYSRPPQEASRATFGRVCVIHMRMRESHVIGSRSLSLEEYFVRWKIVHGHF